MIYTYTQQTILATNFSHSKIPSQVSPIGHGTHTEKKNSLTRKIIRNHHTVVASLTEHTTPSPIRKHLEFT